MAGKRIEYLDFLKWFAIFSVLLGHSTEQLSADLFWDHPLWTFIYSYHMPLFMFLCGYLFPSSLKRSYSKMAAVKVRQLGIPSLTAFAIACVIMWSMRTRAIADLCEFSFAGFMNCVWFLKCLLFCYLIMYPVCKVFHDDRIAAIVASALVIIIPGTHWVNLNFMLPMFCAGMVCRGHSDWVDRNRPALFAVSAAAFLALLIPWSGRLTVYMVPTKVIDTATLAFDWKNLGITVYRIALGISGSLFFFLSGKWVYSFIKRWKWSGTLCKIGTETLGIYFLQTFLLEILVNSLHIFIPLPWSLVAAPVLAVIELIVCHNLVILLKKWKMTRLLILGESD